MGKKKKIRGIYERGNKWIINTTYKGQRIWDTCATFEMAEMNLRKEMTLLDEGRWLDKKKQPKETLEQFSERYLSWCESIGQKDYRSKKQRMVVIVGKLGKETLLGKITRADIEKYQAERSASQSRYKKLLNPATVNRELAVLKHLFTKAVDWRVLDQSPAVAVKLHREKNRRVRYLSAEECRALLAACPSITLKCIILLAIHTGMRKGEILKLKWIDTNLRERFIEIVDQKNGERSTIPLNQTAVETLRAIPRRIDSDYVFTGMIPGEPFADLKRQFEKAVSKAKLQGVTFHTLRHTAASHLVMSGVDLPTVSEILRHKSIEMTMRYSHLSPKHKKSAVDALERSLAQEDQEAQKQA
jgi:integrase